MPDSYVCSGAMMQCTMGTKPAQLTVLPARTVFLAGQPQANISDHISMANLAPFGLCRSLAFPPTAAATAAALGTLTPMPCIHNTPAPWFVGKMDNLIQGQPALLKTCKCQCMWGGTISLITDGQMGEGTQWVQKEGESDGFGNTVSAQQNTETQSTESTGYLDLANKWWRNKLKRWNSLSAKEKRIILFDPRFYKLGSIEANAETATKTAKRYYPNDKGKGDKCDAFRHALWQALNVQKEGENLTRDWSNAHEYSTPPNEIQTDLFMDIHNNEVGIEIGRNNPKASLEELSQIIVDRISNGDMLVINDEELIKSDGSPVLTTEIRGYDTALKIANDILNHQYDETNKKN